MDSQNGDILMENLEPISITQENTQAEVEEEFNNDFEEEFKPEKLSGDIKADDEGEYHSDTDKEKNLKVEISEDAKFSLKQLKEEKTLKRERVDLENDNKHAKENDEPNSKKRALEHLRNMNFNKKDPFNQLGYSRTMNFNRISSDVLQQRYSPAENFETDRFEKQQRRNEDASKYIKGASDIEKEEKRGTRSFLPQNSTKNIEVIGVKNHQHLAQMTKNIINYQGPFKQKVDNLLALPEEQIFRLPDSDLSVLLLYILDTYQEQDKLLSGRKAQLKELDQMIQKERSHVENIGMDLPSPYYANLMEELRNINNDGPTAFSNIYNNNGMQQGYSRNGIPPTAQMNAPSLMGPNAGLPDFRMPPPLFSENTNSQISHAFSNPPLNLCMPPPNFQLNQPPPALNQPPPSLNQPPPAINSAPASLQPPPSALMSHPPPSAMSQSPLTTGAAINVNQPPPSIPMSNLIGATGGSSSDLISTTAPPLLVGFNSLPSFTSKPPPILSASGSSSAAAVSIPMIYATPPPSFFGTSSSSSSNIILQKASITIANTSVPPPNISTSISSGGLPIAAASSCGLNQLTAPPPPINFSLPPPSATTITNNNTLSTESSLNEPILSSSKSLSNLSSLISTPHSAVSLQRPSSATLSQPPPSSLPTTNFSAPPPQLNAPPPNLNALPPNNFPSTTHPSVDISIPPPNIVMKAAMAVAGAVTSLLNQPPPVIPNLKHPPLQTTHSAAALQHNLYANSLDISSASMPTSLMQTGSPQRTSQRPLPLMSLEQPSKFANGSHNTTTTQIRSLASVLPGNLKHLNRNITKSIPKVILLKSENILNPSNNQFINTTTSTNANIETIPLSSKIAETSKLFESKK